MTEPKPHDYTVEVWNSFKELYLEDRVPEELKMEDQNKVQVVVIKTFPKKNKHNKAKWLSEKAVQICEKRREVKGKADKERYMNLNADFQRTARRNMKVFLSEQCKEIEGKKRMGKTRVLFKKIQDTKGTFHAKMGAIKDRNTRDWTEAKYIKTRWQGYTELHKHGLKDPDNNDGVITHREPAVWSQARACSVKSSGPSEAPYEQS